MGRGGGSATIDWEGEEPLGFVPMKVMFRISGTVGAYFPGNYDNPPEGGEVEITEVLRIDPFTGEEKDITGEDWPFSHIDIQHIEEAIADRAEPEYDDPPDYDD